MNFEIIAGDNTFSAPTKSLILVFFNLNVYDSHTCIEFFFIKRWFTSKFESECTELTCFQHKSIFVCIQFFKTVSRHLNFSVETTLDFLWNTEITRYRRARQKLLKVNTYVNIIIQTYVIYMHQWDMTGLHT